MWFYRARIWARKIFGIRVVGEVPIKIAMSLAKFDQPLKESFPGDGLFRIGAGLNCPMMFKACVNSTGAFALLNSHGRCARLCDN